MRLGLRLINGFPEAAGRALEAARPFHSVSELARRLHISRPILARLAAADAFGSLGVTRREALWQVLALGEDLPLFAELTDDEPMPDLPVMPIGRQVTADYQTVGLSLRAHPIGLLRPELERLQVLPSAMLKDIDDKKSVCVAGLVLMRQRPATAKGTIFMTLEDETGIVNLVVWPRVWERFRAIARGATALLVHGKLERTVNGSVIHVMASKFEDLSQALRGLATKSRDFH